MRDVRPLVFDLPSRLVLEETGYNVFPIELETDGLVLFHATAMESVEKIEQSGLQPGNKVGHELTTISFADKSGWALYHWTTVRNGREGAILALRFENLDELSFESGTWYSRELREQPQIIALCAIPITYQHV